MPTLYEITQSVMYLQELLESGDIDEQVYKDSVEGLCAEGKLEDICRVLKNLEYKAAAFKAEADRMTARRKTLENSIQRLKDSMMNYMTVANVTKVEAGLFTVGVRNSKAVNVWDTTRLPEQYLIPQEPKIDKTAISKALKEGEVVDGAEFIENRSLSIR